MTDSGPPRAGWRKSSYSGGDGDCVEVAHDLPAAVAVRDSKNPSGLRLVLAPEEWRRFTVRVRAGRFG